MSQSKPHDALAYVLNAPINSEKTNRLADKLDTVAFWVNVKASKLDIKKAVEAYFKVKVEKVRTLVKGRNHVRFGQIMGRTKKLKKAYVTLSAGQQINFEEFE